MAYIGNTNETQAFAPAIDYFNGNGSSVAFTLSRPVASVAQVQAVIENVPQNPGTAFTVFGNTITFDSPPPSGTNNIYVSYTSPITQVIQPGQGTVGTTQLGNITAINSTTTMALRTVGTTAVTIDASQNVGIGITNPQTALGLASGNNISWGSSNFPYISGDNSTNFLAFGTQATERMRLDSVGNLLFNSGYGSVARAFGCRAWVNFNGTGTVAIRASGNVSSITDNGTGNYTVNFATAMPDANYSLVSTSSLAAGNGAILFRNSGTAQTASSSAIGVIQYTGALTDPVEAHIAVFR
jgi:hypothetical protein